MKKVSIYFLVLLSLILLCIVFFEVPTNSMPNTVVVDETFLNNQDPQVKLPKPNQPDPWTDLEVNYTDITIFNPDSVRPDSVLTFTFTFGNKGTHPMNDVIIKCYPPNMSIPTSQVSFTKWVEEISKGPIEIGKPQFTRNAQDNSLLELIEWNVPTIPGLSGTDTVGNKIEFKLLIDTKTIVVSQDLQCWIGMYYSNTPDVAESFAVVKIRVEVKPNLEIEKHVLKKVILPGEENTIILRTRNNGKRSVYDVVIRDSSYSSIGSAVNWIGVDSIDPQAFDNSLPSLGWTKSEYEPGMEWDTFIIKVRAKPYDEIKFLFAGSEALICDYAWIRDRNEIFDHDKDTFRIIARDLKPKIEPKLFGNYASPGFPLLFNCWIKNVGATPVYAAPYDRQIRVRMWRDDLEALPFFDESLSQGIRAGDSIHVPIESLPLPEGEGQYMFYFEVDYVDDILEIDETNNIDSILVQAKIENFNTTINNVTRTDEINIYGQQPNFPAPIFSYVMINDQNYHYIKGLGSTSKWLASDEQTAFGEGTVKEIWNEVNEYHAEDPNIPPPEKHDVYLEAPLYATRISEPNSPGISVLLIMDSNIPVQDTANVHFAAHTLADLIGSVDQMAVMKVSNSYSIVQNFTNETELLHNAINKTYNKSNYLLLNDAVYDGVTETIKTTGRKAVLVLTAGSNSGSSHSLAEVIYYADTLNVPVFTFGFGAAETTSLKLLAQNSGGLHVYDKESRDMWYIFKLFAEMFKNYYLLSHTSTDITLDGTWRIVDVTANYPSLGFADRATKKYKAPNEGVDLFIIKEAKTDSFSVGGIDTIRYALEGEQFTYTISYGNLGSLPGRTVFIKDILPDSVQFVVGSANPAPERTANQGRELFWGPLDIRPGARETITFDVIVNSQMPPWQTALIDSAFIIFPEDKKQENNTAVNVVYAVTEPPPPPEIRVSPDIIRPRTPVLVEVIGYEELRNWDIKISFENGEVVENHADDFIKDHSILLPGTWIKIVPDFPDTKKRTEGEREDITFIFSAKNIYDQSFVAEDAVTVEAPFEFVLDRNVFKPADMDHVNITLTLPADLTVKTKIFNVAGELIRKLPDKFFLGGETHVDGLSWDGIDANGRVVASGVYVIVAEAGSQTAWKKVVVVR